MKTDHKQLEFMYNILTNCRVELEQLSYSEDDSFIKVELEELTNKAVDFIFEVAAVQRKIRRNKK